MTQRPQPTPADYMVIALSPALIMLLIGSLAFFIITVKTCGLGHGRAGRWRMVVHHDRASQASPHARRMGDLFQFGGASRIWLGPVVKSWCS